MPPLTLFRYLLWRTAFVIVALFAALAALVFVADFVENLRFAGKYADGSFPFALKLTLFRTPGVIQITTPFVFLFGSLWLFHQLNRRSEMSVMRSAGLSVWRLIGPPILFAAVFGALAVTIFDPIATRATGLSEQMKNAIRGKSSSLVQVFGDGIWLRQRDEEATLIINAQNLDAETQSLSNVTIWRLGPDAVFRERIDADRAVFSERKLELNNAQMKSAFDKLPRKTPLYAVKTNLTAEDFRQGTPQPETMSIWDLPHYSRIAEAAGLPTERYDLRFHDLCSTPLKLISMVMIAAIFTLRPVRAGGAFGLVLAGVGVGFLLYFVTEVAAALGESGAAPVFIAAWTPAGLGLIAAATGLLHMEEG